jgi:hypothetical protein
VRKNEVLLWDALADLLVEITKYFPDGVTDEMGEKIHHAQKVLANIERNAEVSNV